MATRTTGTSRADLIADAALALLAERGMRGLTHRAVDERAGLPQGSTSNYARTRQALLEAAVRRLAEREARVLAPAELPAPAAGPEGLVAGLASALHRYLTRHPELLVCRYELALEATRRPELREFFDATGRQFREPLMALMTAAGSTEPARHTLSLVAWCEGLMFSCAAGSFSRSVPSEEELRTGFAEMLSGMLGPRWALH
ncbi:TetR family transcriptional regulator [Streptomyces sp. NBC_00257]|uniref:TetR/AcrR family transcriptional regulator n=1 Tax=unclassified Streptomyces TaxID=2593676 RepID=UPI00225BFA58|nr:MULTISPECIES: TetR family transcriptional regulator [unclassified Streptomyces]WTB52919.1 TetR family transcriptional regulator [Streptomyces sp. NBC_00826]WTH94190.1 TetR family transcriptional regulator [Streptomyces sp. NBC_00825]WTI02925.1 TetR family transcriptional regulator [Streptomyces sp. NBC_00822]MCX4868583.1 TetR family transcriptional regulator [Streptomyces sp. NBC_00906]MCX4899821.1 TetR family transcriptional regulator [Streptomyces sp. NBC_00892]